MLATAVSADKMPIVERTDLLPGLSSLVACAADARNLLGVLIIEIQQLDEINHQYGYHVGDALVRTITDQVKQHKRGTDILLRIGTNELLLVLPELKSNGQTILAAQRILRHCTQRFQLFERWIKPALKIGVSLYPQDADGALGLIRGADAALLQARERNQDIVTGGEKRVAFETTILETQYDLENAIATGELFCQFQPKVDLATRRFVSAESLSRWQTANGTMIPPGKFIRVAEQNGLIIPLTFRSLNESLRECASLQDEFPGLSVAVNLSANVFVEPNIKDIISEALQIWSLPSNLLILEVTESALVHDIDENAKMLKEFRDLGIGVSIDDFGTGYSSLAYLRKLPATELKIDQSFVRSMATNPNDRQLVQAIINIAADFKLKTVAEGIEDHDTLDQLNNMGCSMAQGFFIAEPMLPDQLPAWFSRSGWGRPSAAPRAGRA